MSVIASPANRAVFFDRDGVLNETVRRDGRSVSPRTIQELRLVPGIEEDLRALRAAGYRIFIITNQPDLTRGTMLREEHDAIMARVEEAFAPDDVAVCAHDDANDCPCRKPKPGMITALAKKWNIALDRSFVIGDSWRDVEAGRRAGCRTILVVGSEPTVGGADVLAPSPRAGIAAIIASSQSENP